MGNPANQIRDKRKTAVKKRREWGEELLANKSCDKKKEKKKKEK